MITVTVFVNGSPIFTRSARNCGESKDGLYRYKIDTGDVIYHKRDDGFVPLVKMMLDTVEDIDEELND
jgi:hypothetical protein